MRQEAEGEHQKSASGSLFWEARDIRQQKQARSFNDCPFQSKAPGTRFDSRPGTDAFDDLLEVYNFTVREDTPLNQDVAIDPEMLGKIFESLVLQLEQTDASGKTSQHDTGSRYTPRPIVHHFSREGLRTWLEQSPPDPARARDWPERLAKLLDIDTSDGIDPDEEPLLESCLTVQEARVLLKRLDDLRACDPAVGSGAFPVGIPADNVSSVFEARRDLRPAAKLVVKGSGLGIEEADILILLYSIRKLGGTECRSYDGYVNFTDLKKAMVRDASLFSRRVKRLETEGLVHIRPSRQGDPALHAKAQQVRIEDAGVKVVAPVWERYCQFSEELLKGFTQAELDFHYKVNRGMSRIVRDRLDPAKQLLGL